VCPQGHAFDIARSGYVNLLQPQDRRSAHAGDAREAIEARARLSAAGIGRAVASRVAELLGLLSSGRNEPASGDDPAQREADAGGAPDPMPVVVELGCGSGEMLASLARSRRLAGIGIDISTAAIDVAARACPELTWIVANADRRLPVLDAAADAVISIHARRNPGESARMLKPGGTLIVAIPAPDDLIELREQVMGARMERDRSALLLGEHADRFSLTSRETVREHHELSADRLRDLLQGTYRGSRRSAGHRIEGLDRLPVTTASEIFVFSPRDLERGHRGTAARVQA
jgi:23S rRNA (guanine745-N1)-methyltransferase